jgi:CRP/FNR family cyclic AMP-dependent transcriptional regulator
MENPSRERGPCFHADATDERLERGREGGISAVGGPMESSRVAAIPFFADLPEDELAAVASVASEVEIPSGQALAAEGRIGHSLFAVESGTADVVIAGATVGTIGPGDVVGEMAVFASPPDPFAPPEVAEGGFHTASVVATSRMRLIALFKHDVWALDRRAPAATQRLRAVLDERRAKNAQRALAEQRAQDEQGGSPGSDPLAGSA